MDLIQAFIKKGCPVTNRPNWIYDIQTWLIDTHSIYITCEPDISYSLRNKGNGKFVDHVIYLTVIYNLKLYYTDVEIFDRDILDIENNSREEALLKGFEKVLNTLKDK